MAIRLSKCCNAKLENKYWCPNCDRVCKSYEVSDYQQVKGLARVIDIDKMPYYEQEPAQNDVVAARVVSMPTKTIN